MTSNKNKYTVLALGAIIATTGAVSIADANEHGRGWRMNNESNDGEMQERRGQGWGRNHRESNESHAGRGERGEMGSRRDEQRGHGEQAENRINNGSETEAHTLDFSQYPMGILTEGEKTALVHMREEEKMARDVYRTLSKTTDSRAFVNIPVSEKRHMDVFAQLIDRYSLIDPVQDESIIGVFTDTTFTAKYNELITKGKLSDKDAFEAGAMVEDINMFNLLKYRSETNKPDLIAAYDQLFTQSQHHMSAFIRNLEKMGAIYTPTLISQEQLDLAVQSGQSHMQEEARNGGQKAMEMENEIDARYDTGLNQNQSGDTNGAVREQIRSLQNLLKGLLEQLISLLGGTTN